LIAVWSDIERMGVVVESLQLVEERRIVIGRHRRLARQPGENILIGKFHQLLEAAKIGLIERRDRRIRECAHQEVHFANAAMPSPKTQTPPANLGVGKPDTPVLSLPAGGASSRSGRLYIAMASTRVIVAKSHVAKSHVANWRSWDAPG
jgi:hypothetical protein